MPTVPDLVGPQVLPDVKGAYEVRAVDTGRGLTALGQGVNNLTESLLTMRQRQMEMEAKVAQKREEAGANAAISGAAEKRINAELAYGQELRSATTREQTDKALENFNKAVELGDAEVTRTLSGDYERQEFNNWSTRDALSRKERTVGKFLDRQNHIITESAVKQVDLSAVDYAHSPDPVTRAAFDVSVSRYTSAANMTPEAAQVYTLIKTRELHNDVIQTQINADDPVSAKAYLDEHKAEMDPKTWSDFAGTVEKHINENAGKQAGAAIASQAETVDADGRIQVDYKKIEEDIKALPPEQQEFARSRANDRIQEGVKLRTQVSTQLYLNVLPLVKDGSVNPETIPPSERAKFTPADWMAIKREREVWLKGEEAIRDETAKKLQDSSSAVLSSKAMLELDSLSVQDKPEAVAILMSKLTPDVRSAMTKTDIDMLTKHAEVMAKGGSVASFNDIMSAIGTFTNKPTLRTDKKTRDEYLADNPELLTMIQDRTRGVSEDNMQKALMDATRAYLFKTRQGDTVADVVRTGDKRRIEALELDLSKQDVDAFAIKNKMEKELSQYDEASKRRYVTRLTLRSAGLLDSYRIDANGDVIPVPVNELFQGLEKVTPPSPLPQRGVNLDLWNARR